MKLKRSQYLLLLLFVCTSSLVTTQVNGQTKAEEPRQSITVGVLQGGGSLIGADLEFLLTDQLGFQIGAGLVGFGAGVNVHFKPGIRSSFMSLQYWNQGFGDNFSQRIIGPNYVYRGPKGLTFQLGLGLPIARGPALPADFVQPPVMLMYALGFYLPL